MIVEDGIIEGNSITFELSGPICTTSIQFLDVLIDYADRAGLRVTLDLDRVESIHAEVIRELRLLEARGIRFARRSRLPVHLRTAAHWVN